MKSSLDCRERMIAQHDLLPVLPPGVPYLLKALADENIDFQELEIILGRFPSIVARLLSLANSSWVSPQVPVTSLKWACSLSGQNLVRSVSIALSVSSPFDPTRCPGFDSEHFWCTALLAADGAVLLASSTESNKTFDARALHTAGLLHNLGLLWLADNKPKETARAFRLVAADDEKHVAQCLQDIVGMDYCEVGGCLGRAWSLPDIFVTIMEHQGNSNYTGVNWWDSTVVGVAANMVSARLKGLDCPPEDSLRLEQLNIKRAQRDEVYVQLIEKMNDTRELARILFS